jgi:hypothetical protein
MIRPAKFEIRYHDEDSASAALSSLFVHCRAALMVFCKMVDPKGVWRESASRLMVENQHRTERGRKIDVLIWAGDRAIIVECKVLDSVKPFQLRTYHDYWFDKTGNAPLLVWLVQRPQRVMGWGFDQAEEVTWNRLSDALIEELGDVAEVQDFCNALDRAGIVMPSGECVKKRKLTKGYDQDHASGILNGILGSLPGVEGSVEEVNELPPALHVGRKEWEQKFRWIRRVWIYLKPLSYERNVVGPFTYMASVRIFRHGERDTYEMEVGHFLRRAKICVENGLCIKRNVPGKWRHWFDLKLPFELPAKAGLKGMTAYDPAGLNPKPFFNWRDEREAVKAGVKFCQRFLKIVDKC